VVQPDRSPHSPHRLRFIEKTPLNVVIEVDEDLENLSVKGSRMSPGWREAYQAMGGRRRTGTPFLLVLVLLMGTLTLVRTGVSDGEVWWRVGDVEWSLFGKGGQLSSWDTPLELGGGLVFYGDEGKGAGMKGEVGRSKPNDGLLHRLPYDPDLGTGSSPHPITFLIDQAQAAWAEKNARQSTTLHEAVKEYQRRYGRAPPVGFAKWWRYVK
jgi:hypothetical protein